MPKATIEIGKTYALAPGPDSVYRHHAGRKGLVVRLLEDDLFEVRWANGSTFLAAASELRGPVEAAAPGVDEGCIVCGGARVAKEYKPDPKRGWIQHEVGEVPRPNCRVET